jgi:hypothetical protein
MASGVVHGTEAGAIGLRRSSQTAGDITRLGRSLELMPTALLYGTEAFLRLASSARPLVAVGITEVLSACGRVRQVWPDYRKAVLDLDRSLWPDLPLTTRTAVYGMGSGGTGRWFVWEADRDLIAPASKPVNVPDWVQQMVDSERRRLDSLSAWDDPAYPKGATGLISLAIDGMQVEKKPGAEWSPAALVMIQDPFDQIRYEETIPSAE